MSWLTRLLRAEPQSVLTSAEIGTNVARLKRRVAELTAEQDAVALDALHDDRADARFAACETEIATIFQQIRRLERAKPEAEARERRAAEQAESECREQALAQYRQDSARDRLWFQEDVLAAMLDEAVLTRARDRSAALRAQAAALGSWCGDADVRRPFDPLGEIVKGLHHRLDRIARSRWAPTQPITLGGGSDAATMAEAVARVATVDARRTS